ncbi:sodium/hydrogen exchanger 9B2 [Galendromus occidentalis]|uniref:Sodium/hydrogen exchanger 9B2 n=1 Tax=Galendromus occidentalis TaxID=34638 RepID=A0AAJ7SD25_9ACAR|nr:sodium/hydrogen exchanger 9B2 [Galendromus occidentalis]
MALAVILLRAGLGLDLSVLKALSAACIRLTFLPCFAEAASICVVSHLVLGLPYTWGLLLGFVLAAVSPAVVVPAMIDLTNRKLGTDKGIPTLLMAASSFDDVAAITGFGVVLGTIFSGGTSLALTLASGPLEAIAGLLIGGLLGVLLATMFRANRRGEDQFDLACALHLVIQGIMAVFISNRLNFGGVGPLTAITASAVAVIVWKKQGKTSDPDSIAQTKTCSSVLASFWLVFEPVLFSLIGMEIQLNRLKPATVTGGLLTLAICLTIRVIVTFFAVGHSTLNVKERIFVCVGWLPKATVQAALAPTAMDMVRRWTAQGKPLEKMALHYSETVLTVSVIAIMVTAPIGAVAISVLAPRLLRVEKTNPDEGTECSISLKDDDGGLEERS